MSDGQLRRLGWLIFAASATSLTLGIVAAGISGGNQPNVEKFEGTGALVLGVVLSLSAATLGTLPTRRGGHGVLLHVGSSTECR